MPLKVLMMGGLRCGKTSALASLFAQMRTSPVANYLTVSDRTLINCNLPHHSFSDKIFELQLILEMYKDSGRLFLLDKNPSCCFNNYTLHFQIPGTQDGFDINFIDSVGTFFNAESFVHAEEVRERIMDSDVFIIAVDTPYIMGSMEEDTKDLCPDVINQYVNCVHGLQTFMTYIDDNEGKDAKMVVFVPLKCEKWAKTHGGLDKVTARIKEVYTPHIRNLFSLKKVSIAIIPMQTSGNILFSEFRKPYIYESIEGKTRCCKLDDEIIRKEDGELEILREGETVLEDEEAVLYGTNLHKPFSWFQVNPNDSSYSPVNCDQPGLHILRFIFLAFMDAEKEKYRRHYILPPANRYREWLGSMNIQQLQYIIERLQYDGIIKDNCDGIEIIKNF